MADITTTDGAAELTRLMQLAVEQGESGVAALERLVTLQERAQAKAAEQAHAAALAAFQREATTVAYDAAGAHGARYATLAHILDSIRDPLARNGLAVTFDSEEVGDRLRVYCDVHHALGHSSRASFTVSREAPSNRMNATQRDGSALSYGRRYALGLALGLTTGERDDDGEAAMRPAPRPVSGEQLETIERLYAELESIRGESVDRKPVLDLLKLDSFDRMTDRDCARVVQLLQRKIAEERT